MRASYNKLCFNVFNVFLSICQVCLERLANFVMCLDEFFALAVLLDEHDVLECGCMLVAFASELVHIVLERAVLLVEMVYQVRVRIALSLPIQHVLLY